MFVLNIVNLDWLIPTLPFCQGLFGGEDPI